MNKLFVYGTLVGRYENAEKAKLTNATKKGLAVEPDPGSEVEGEIIKVDDAELQRLDRYEGTPTNYKRHAIDEDLEIYIANPEHRGLEYDFNELDSEFDECEVVKDGAEAFEGEQVRKGLT